MFNTLAKPSIAIGLAGSVWLFGVALSHAQSSPSRTVDISRQGDVEGGDLAGVLHLRAIDATSRRPIPEYKVLLGYTTKQQQQDPAVRPYSDLFVNGSVLDQGHSVFRIDRLPIGMPFQVTLTAKGYIKKRLPRIDAVLGLHSEPMDIELTKADPNPSRIVSGTLSDTSGRPVGAAKLSLIVGEDSPIKSRWLFYHWYTLESGEVRRARQCLQYMTTQSKPDGTFRFEGVEPGNWMEIIHSGGHTANGRHVLLDPADTPNLEGLELVANYPGAIVVTFDAKKNSDAFAVRIEANNWSTSDTPFAFAIKEIPPNRQPLTFDNLPPGSYRLSLQTRPISLGMGNVSVQTLKTISIDIDEEDEKIVEF